MQKLVVFFLVVFSVTVQAGLNPDSLLNLLSQATGDQKARVLNQLSEHYQKTDSIRSLGYARQALALSRKSGNKTEMSAAFYNIGECFYFFGQYAPALDHYDHALGITKTLGDRERVGEIHNSIALARFFRGESDRAVESLMEALRCLKNTDAKKMMAIVYSNMGMVYLRLEDYRRSIDYYRKAVEINRGIGNLTGVAVNYNGIGVGYYDLGKLDSSRMSYEIALKGFQAVHNREKEAVALNNIANVYVDQGDSLSKALDYFQRALAVFEELDDKRGRTFTLASLGAAYRVMGEENKAIETLQSGLELAQKHHLGYYIIQNLYHEFSKTYEGMGKVNEAYAAYKLHRTYLDSLRDGERIRQVAELEKKFETEKKEEEILRLNAEREVARLEFQRERNTRVFLTAIFLLSLGTTMYFSYGYFQKKKMNRVLNQKNEQIECQRNELEKMNATKNRFFSILAHDLKNPFHTVLGYSSLLSSDYERFTESERKKYAGDVYKSAHTIFRLLQNLLEWGRSQTGALKFNPVKFDLLQLTESVYGLLKPMADQKKIRLINQVSSGIYLYADPMMVETILRNLVSNAIKFSYPGGKIVTHAVSDETDRATVCVSDQGAGLSEEDIRRLFLIDSKVRRKGTRGEEGSGLGLPLCNELIRLNKGTIRVESELDKGSSFLITLPLAFCEDELSHSPQKA